MLLFGFRNESICPEALCNCSGTSAESFANITGEVAFTPGFKFILGKAVTIDEPCDVIKLEELAPRDNKLAWVLTPLPGVP
jgi:hypothetical protein